MTQTLNVEYQELLARAAEIEQPLPPVPSTNPPGPCGLTFVTDAAARLALNADNVRMYLKGLEREWKALAKSLRNAAKAYEQVETEGAEAIASTMNSGSSASTVAPAVVVAEEEPWTAPPPLGAASTIELPYYEVRQAAAEIEAGDQGTAFRAFAQEWQTFQRALLEQTNRFRLFNNWEGEARDTVEQNFQKQREYVITMAALCGDLAKQANRVVDVHKKAAGKTGYDDQYALDGAHPTSYEVALCDYWYSYYATNNQAYLPSAIDWYEKLQAQSESALSYYVKYANLPLPPLNPPPPPKATVIHAPGEGPKPEPKPDPKPDPKPTPTPGLTTPQLGQLAGGLQGLGQGMQGVMQGVQGAAQSFQGLGQGAAAPAQLASDTAPVDEEKKKDDETTAEEEAKAAEEAKAQDEAKAAEEAQRQAPLAEGAAPGTQTAGPVPTEPPPPGRPEAPPKEIVL
ncbi:hypothetical protein A5730_02800 [Mycobacterium sp. ACS4054]|uniref:PPE domain-containing protein n=1 Tax=Mycobacterium sp. ACS4054 TaxID=1834119 RepID=UPI000801BD22|nr:hypothetical protein [Mycobacterium sp. ACS4054]OBF13459.1 hypothetical protein A5730_02800 [Mycobacterium sp. ACS4054]